MTVKERLSTIGQALMGHDPVREIVKEIKKEVKAKNLLVGTIANVSGGLSNDKTISVKLLEANKGWVYRNNDVIAKEVSQIEFELYSFKVVTGEVVFTPIAVHPCLDALDRFNEFTTASDGFYTIQSHRKLTGDSFLYVDGAGPNVKGLYILPPDKVTIDIGKITGNQRVIDDYEYKDTIDGKTVKETYKPEEIIHFKVPNPKRYFRGMGVVEAIADDIDLDSLAIEANKKLYERGMIGSFALSTDKGLTDEQMKRLRAELQSAYGGVNNAFKIPILSGGLEPKDIQMTNKDMQFIAMQEWIRDKIISAFGNNKAILGITDDVNRANAEATINNWKQTTIKAEMKQITDTLNEFFVPRFGDNLILGFKDPSPENELDKIARVSQLIQDNVITPDEARELLGYDALPNGQGANIRETLAIQAIPKSLQNVSLNRVMRKDAYKQVEFYNNVKVLTDKIAKKITQPKKEVEAYKEEAVDNVMDYYQKQINIVDHAENIFRNKVEQFIAKLVEKALAKVPEEIAKIQKKQLFNEDEELSRATLDFTPLLNDVAIAAGTQAMNLINSNKPYILTDISRRQIEDRVRLFATSLIDTDKNKLIDLIRDGIEEGLSVPDIKRNITETFGTYSKTQAQVITRTEVIKASNSAALDAFKQSGIVTGKQWLTAPGADAECEEFNGKKVYDLDGSFYSTDSEFTDGDPPIHPNCRCIVLPLLEERDASS